MSLKDWIETPSMNTGKLNPIAYENGYIWAGETQWVKWYLYKCEDLGLTPSILLKKKKK